MTISARIREERQRLGMTQTAFGELAGVTKSAQIKWERGGTSSPTAPALAAWAEAGADALYILTGRRTGDGPDMSPHTIDDTIRTARGALLDPLRFSLPGEAPDQAEERVLQHQIEVLSLAAGYKGLLGSAEQQAEVAHLLAIATDPQRLTAFRAADHAQLRGKRKRIKERFVSYLEMNDRQPTDAAINIMVEIALEYGVPVGPLVELALELIGGHEHDS